jgi:tRNA pseudouridine-54 N-methylase
MITLTLTDEEAQGIILAVIKNQTLLLNEITNKGNQIMATLQEIKDTIAFERQQVADAVTALQAQIAALQEQLATGTVVTQADLDALNALIQEIFTPPVAP